MTEEQKQPQPAPQTPPSSPPGPAEAEGPSAPEFPPVGETTPPGETMEPKPPSPWRRRLRRFLWLLAGVVLLYVCGLLSAVVLVVQPLESQYQQALLRERELNDQIASLQATLEAQEAQLKAMEQTAAQTEAKVASLEEAELRRRQEALLNRAQKGLYKGIAALYEKDTLTARLALRGALQDLSELSDIAPEEWRDVLQDLQQELEDLLPQLTATNTTLLRLQRIADALEEVANQLER